jgi:2,3-bisphosphoglycerate-independent phosphoglycerate mutase
MFCRSNAHFAARLLRARPLARAVSSTRPTLQGDGPVVLCILDGWGWRETARHNAVVQGHTPNFDSLYGSQSQLGQTSFLYASEKHVGLPEGQIGNSEVGHMNIGAGRIVYQDICRIDNAIEDGSMKKMDALVAHIEKLKESGGTCHVMGLVSPGGVHAMQSHVAELANTVSRAGVPVLVHAFTDGRDVPPNDAGRTMVEFQSTLDSEISIATVTGRYYALDRDNRWERVGAAYDAVRSGKGVAPNAGSADEAIANGYGQGLSDEFFSPTVVGGYDGMKDGDGILMCNYRADRAREILTALAAPEELSPEDLGRGQDGRDGKVEFADVAGIVNYSSVHDTFMSAIFPPKEIDMPLGEALANAGMTQLRMAETEKYPHVTFFLNGGREEPFEGEDRILVASPKVATYDLQPEMSAPELGGKLVEAVDSKKYKTIIVNFANPDMVGHSGILEAAVKAVESVDVCLGNLIESVRNQKGALLVTADHGNCEKMWDDVKDEPHTAHTLAQVPIMYADYRERDSDGSSSEPKLRDGVLADIAPTMLELLGVEQPASMTGKSLLKPSEAL